MTVNNEDIKRVKAMGFLFNRESEDEFSARVITENGTLTGDQLHNIADAAQRFAGEGLLPDVICVDPPRKGLAPAVIDAMVQMAPTRIVYVSCDPATLARDVARLREEGYELRSARAVDMFPRCAHVETVALLTR